MAKESGTAYLKVYLVQDNYTLDEIEEFLREEKGYSELNIRANVTKDCGMNLSAWVWNSKESEPDWKAFIEPYIEQESIQKIGSRQHSNFVLLAQISPPPESEPGRIFAIPGGYAATHIAQFFDGQFGFDVFGRIFDPKHDLITNVDEKAVIGDVLASARFYRNPRLLYQENNFGRIFSRLSIRTTEDRIKQHLRTLYMYRKDLGKPAALSFEGSAFFDLKMKIDFPSILDVLKEFNALLDMPLLVPFNKTLILLNKRKDKETIKKLEDVLASTIIEIVTADSNPQYNLSICPTDFKGFYDSSCFSLDSENVDDREDLERLVDLSAIRAYFQSIAIYDEIEKNEALQKEAFLNLRISTYQDDTAQFALTSGKLKEYCNIEIGLDDNISYFLMNDSWYRIESDFDEDLYENFKNRVINQNRIQSYPMLPKWPSGTSEGEYFKELSEQDDFIVVHPHKIGSYIEICDALYFDGDTVHLIFAKKGINVSTRDFVSQVIITTRIIQEESRQANKPSLKTCIIP